MNTFDQMPANGWNVAIWELCKSSNREDLYHLERDSPCDKPNKTHTRCFVFLSPYQAVPCEKDAKKPIKSYKSLRNSADVPVKPIDSIALEVLL